MKFTVTFEVESVTQNNGEPVEVYPIPGGPVITGVGRSVTGRYIAVAPPRDASENSSSSVIEHPVSKGFFSFNRTNSYVNSKGQIVGTGITAVHLTQKHHSIFITTTYNVVIGNSGEPFSSVRHVALITGAMIDGAPYTGTIEAKSNDGGRSYRMTFNLKKLVFIC